MDANNSRITEALAYIRSISAVQPKLALILGSGLGDFADYLQETIIINTTSIPHYPHSSVQGHEGKLIFGYLKEENRRSCPLLVFKGRVHLYESGDLQKVYFPIEIASALGATHLFVTNAAGGINPRFQAGDLMLIDDVINLSLQRIKYTELASINTIGFNELQRDRKPLLDKAFSAIIQNAATYLNMTLHRGTYCWVNGPSYESSAEIEMMRRLGADAVGMSTVPEILVASYLGMKVAGVSLISNLSTGLSQNKLSHSEVTEVAMKVKDTFCRFAFDSIMSFSS
ncbi:MAG: purine-nucleoside phosphorylase [bacterium]